MSEQITIWHVGNTGLRNPNRVSYKTKQAKMSQAAMLVNGD